ncbi:MULTISPECIES: NAD-dependent epimerase/dehydratase family protein [Rhizobium]|uniref:NAD(P)-dependent oxidoreductase n=1 Tax=Rhizobium tropici TaxID=398 RepID=A0A6P1C548_RHITR|nr:MULTISPECIES: NAD(P)-dependent oxidoreductase [Rhizobium]AGB72302.1 sulfolipid biosynthesis protein [Rhizobium tropici CIAT 899]MBB4243114.1 nucleoside-diphosphate-sugar epimerase [Rhizobium tropici]MBB5594757.1 nucleoside-diphosphate-sugar epimerase [Rhizobium tropici]MBB6493440.1 nucleoside-diphosphate-sugar epimerase [Rhizobium tropici]NEV11827.1 NAD(P)-dependent oxidoreductase [Rhizobium tropici]
MKVLISGGAGLVGRYIAEELLSAGYKVVIGGRSPPPLGFFSHPVSFVPLSLDPAENQSRAFDDAYLFVHAAFNHVAAKYRGGEGEDPESFRRLNLNGTVKLFETAKKAGIRRCIFLSSRAVYGDGIVGQELTEASTKPNTLYGEIKRDAEHALFSLSTPGFATASLRATGVYGDLRPNKWDDLFDDYLSGKPVPSRAGTEVHGRDVGRAVRLLLETEAGRIDGEAFNLSDILTDTHEILSHLQSATGCPHALPQPAELGAVSVMDTAKIRALGWQAGGTSLLKQTIETLAKSAPRQAGFSASASSRPNRALPIPRL